MSLERIIERSKRLEGLLKGLGYRGKGLHELVTQAEPSLDKAIVRACRKVATIRNKAVHEEGYRLNGQALKDFMDTADYAAERLSALPAPKPRRIRPQAPDRTRPARPRTLRPVRRTPVFGKRETGARVENRRTPVRTWLIGAGLAIGAAGAWFWTGLRD